MKAQFGVREQGWMLWLFILGNFLFGLWGLIIQLFCTSKGNVM